MDRPRNDFPPQDTPPDREGEGAPTGWRKISTNQWRLATLIAVSAVGSITAWSLSEVGLGASGLYFIAIPALLAVLITLIPVNDDPTAPVIRAGIVAVLASAIVVREGFICVLMALPLVIPVVAVVVWAVRRGTDGNRTMKAFVVPALLLALAGEGATYSLPADDIAREVRVIDATAEELETTLGSPGRLPDLEPLLFRLPFPRPTGLTGSGLAVGDERTVEFTAGSIELAVAERTDDSVTWAVESNTTPIANWLTLRTITARWSETITDDGTDGVELTMEIVYSRGLNPAFYFGPLERFGVGEMAEVLADLAEDNLR